MGITPKFTDSDVNKRFNAFIEVIEKRQIQRLQKLGEECVTHAKLLPPEIGFHDQTGNLRASIGYMVFKDGVAVVNGFYDETGGKDTPTGITTGMKVAQEIGAGYPEGIVLVVVAGMNYAAALEAGGAWKVKSKRGYDVLASAELLAEQKLPEYLAGLVANIEAATA